MLSSVSSSWQDMLLSVHVKLAIEAVERAGTGTGRVRVR